MTVPPVAATARAGLDRVLFALLALAGLAWALAAWMAAGSGDMTGTAMGLSWFLLAWVPMVSAMMLPSVIPMARMWLRLISREVTRPAMRVLRTSGFIAGYMAVWVATGLPAYGLATLDDRLGMQGMRILQAAVVAGAGIYQFTPLKRMCLRHCRTPLASLLRYTSWSGPARDLRVGLAHGTYCTGCCWGLMAVMVVISAMDLRLAVGLTAVVVLEKSWRHGERLAQVIGVALILLAPAVLSGLIILGPTA